MPQYSAHFDNGIIHYSTKDAVFRTLDGRPVSMEFHRYCGPFFEVGGDDGWLPISDSHEWHNLWKQFDGWMAAKGSELYPSLVTYNEKYALDA